MEKILLVIRNKFKKFFCINCPNCKNGVLHVTGVHFTVHHNEINVYECDKCGKKFI